MKYQRVPMAASPISKRPWCGTIPLSKSGVDADFDKPTPRHRIEKPTLLCGVGQPPAVHDRPARRPCASMAPGQVIDMNGEGHPRPLLRRRVGRRLSASTGSPAPLARATIAGRAAAAGAAARNRVILNAPISRR